MTAAVLCAGRVYCDVILQGLPRFPTLGTEVFAEGLALRAGGGAAITAAHLAALGRDTHLAAILPAAPFGTPVRDQLTVAGVDLSRAPLAAPGTDPQITVAIPGQGDRAFVTRRPGAACPDLGPGQFSAFRHLHIGELTTLIEQPNLLPAARSAGLTISLDCAWDDAITADAAPLIAGVDIFFPNAAEYAALHALGLPDPLAPLTVVKRGPEGAQAITSEITLSVPTTPTEVIDATGAGDAFNAGFLHAWLNGAALAECLTAGNSRGRHAVGITGGFALP